MCDIFEKHSEPLMCNICKIDFKSISGLKCHNNKHHTDTPLEYPCSKCNSTFLSPQERSQHGRNRHSTDADFHELRCRLCPEKFQEIDEKKEHIKTQHSNEISKFSCQFCGVSRHTQIRLELHEAECYPKQMEKFSGKV